jgi:hypothetical protein
VNRTISTSNETDFKRQLGVINDKALGEGKKKTRLLLTEQIQAA